MSIKYIVRQLGLDARGRPALPMLISIRFGEALYEDFEEVTNVNRTPDLFNRCLNISFD
jgi:hypothetical protein